jgi:uncharacterized protein
MDVNRVTRSERNGYGKTTKTPRIAQISRIVLIYLYLWNLCNPWRFQCSANNRGIARGAVEILSIQLNVPDECNIIVGQSHFIKTIEDLYEAMVTGCPCAKFGIAFCEASGPCLIRVEGNDAELKKIAAENAMIVGAGHLFVLLLKNAFPINVLNAIKTCSEVCQVFCATANPLEVVVAETGQGRGVLGVIDGFSPKGVETEEDALTRKDFLRKIGYKR